MHEMGIAMQIVDIAVSALPEGLPAGCVGKVRLRVGQLAAVIPGSLRFCYGLIAEDTPLAGSSLDIEEVPVRLRCRSCHARWRADGPDFTCKKCHEASVDIVSGRELDIVSIEVAAGAKRAD